MDDSINLVLELLPHLNRDIIKQSLQNNNGNVEETINQFLSGVSGGGGDGNGDGDENGHETFVDTLEDIERRKMKEEEEKENERLLREMLRAEQDEINENVNEKREYECSICYCSLPINDFYIMDECEHRFCNDCLRHHYGTQIRSRFPNIKCPDLKCKRIVTYEEVNHIITTNPLLVQAYEKLLLDKALEKDPNIRQCPTPDCKNQLIMEPEDTVFECSQCGYAYCLKCREEDHGSMSCETWTNCKIYIARHTIKEHTDNQYASYTNHKLKNGSRYVFWRGRKWRQRHIDKELLRAQALEYNMALFNYQTEDERMFVRWALENTSSCPNCQALVEKNGGCNHMTCLCGCSYCHVCGKSEYEHDSYFPCNGYNRRGRTTIY